MKINSEKIQPLLFVLFFIFSATFLSYIAKEQELLAENESRWSLYFKNPKGESVDFIIESNLENSDFHWEIFLDKTRVQQGDVTISKGSTKEISITTLELANRKIRIEVIDSFQKKKYIYKTITNN